MNEREKETQESLRKFPPLQTNKQYIIRSNNHNHYYELKIYQDYDYMVIKKYQYKKLSLNNF